MTAPEPEGFTISTDTYETPAGADPWAALTAIAWLVFLVALCCSPAVVLAAWRWAL
jgi:hypothetical protein